jgi:hypothetical protein
MLVERMFDEANYEFNVEFETANNLVHSVLNTMIEVENAQVIGRQVLRSIKFTSSPTDGQGVINRLYKQIASNMKKSFVFAQQAGVGRHSIFVYDPV